MTIIEELHEILDGIDKDECEYDDGWWETSTGAEFGAGIQKQLEKFILSKLQEEKLKLLDRVTLEKWDSSTCYDANSVITSQGHNLAIGKLESLKLGLRKELE